ncbi:MAG: SAM-dependent DNA methyltransferase [Gammaproteobacteria bacterium]|nr:SAM-dependent DNA methyltransferase [Gammaproteobacteria bacterium]
MAQKQDFPLRDAIQELRTSTSEDEVRSLLREIFVALGLKQWRLEYPVSTGVADMVNFPARIVIETKKPGLVNPNAKSASDETQFEQLTRYVSGIIDQRTIFDRIDESDEWHGYLTDGKKWWGYQWNDGPRKLIPIPQVQGISVHFDVEPFSDFVHQHFKRRTQGKDIPPDDIASTLVDPLMEPLSSLQRSLESEVFYQTKIGLWRKVLQGSGIVPSDSSPLNQSYVFLRHSVIVALARMLIAYLSNAAARSSELVSNTLDGFQGWITEAHSGVQLLTAIGENIRKYDWRGSARDVLKDVYHGLIDPVHRQEFGEYYTPDHLAREIVRYTLDDDWCDDAIVRAHQVISGQNSVSTENLGVLDPSCGSGTFLYHAARRILGRISTNHLTLKSKSPLIVSRLIHGVDVNPIAVEMAKATLAMALPATLGGVPKLRVALADAMQTNVGPVFEKLGLYITTPAESSFFVPDEIVSHPNSDSLIEAAVEAAVQHEKPSLDRAEFGDRILERVEELSNSLTPIIKKESNHVWV